MLVEKNLLRPVGIAVYDQFLYWIDSQARVIKRVRKESGSEMRTIQADIDELTDLAALDQGKKMSKSWVSCGILETGSSLLLSID